MEKSFHFLNNLICSTKVFDFDISSILFLVAFAFDVIYKIALSKQGLMKNQFIIISP